MPHTPGPWRPGYHSEADRAREMIVRAEDVDDQPYIAILPNLQDGHCEDNARLIAAAPDLLAACRSLSRPFLIERGWKKEADMIQAAIAKATGREST